MAEKKDSAEDALLGELLDAINGYRTCANGFGGPYYDRICKAADELKAIRLRKAERKGGKRHPKGAKP